MRSNTVFNRRRRRHFDWGLWGGLAFAAIIVGLIVWYPIALTNSRHEVTITVEDKERGSGKGENKTATLVFAEDKTYEVADSIWATHWSSGDTYRKLKRGETYTCTVQGWRIPFLSAYENIIDCDGF